MIVVSAFDRKYFDAWGNTWLASLRTRGMFDGEILLFDLGGMPSLDVSTLPAKSVVDAWFQLADMENETFAWWDGDGYFFSGVNGVSELGPGLHVAPALERSVYADWLDLSECVPPDAVHRVSEIIGPHPVHSGFVAGNTEAWRHFRDTSRFLLDSGFVKDGAGADTVLLNMYRRYMPCREHKAWLTQVAADAHWAGCAYGKLHGTFFHFPGKEKWKKEAQPPRHIKPQFLGRMV
jgi:hypothetical protein